jgi:hypothetical protein
MTPTIIGFNEQTATISIGLKYGCLMVNDVATFKAWEQACDKYETTCVPAGCGMIKQVKTLIQPLSVSFHYAGKDSNGRAMFTIPQVVKNSPQAYWQGEMEMCGRKVKVRLQKNNNVRVSSVSSSVITGYVDYVVDGKVVCKLATIAAGCLQPPDGFVAVNDPATGNLLGYASVPVRNSLVASGAAVILAGNGDGNQTPAVLVSGAKSIASGIYAAALGADGSDFSNASIAPAVLTSITVIARHSSEDNSLPNIASKVSITTPAGTFVLLDGEDISWNADGNNSLSNTIVTCMGDSAASIVFTGRIT